MKYTGTSTRASYHVYCEDSHSHAICNSYNTGTRDGLTHKTNDRTTLGLLERSKAAPPLCMNTALMSVTLTLGCHILPISCSWGVGGVERRRKGGWALIIIISLAQSPARYEYH